MTSSKRCTDDIAKALRMVDKLCDKRDSLPYVRDLTKDVFCLGNRLHGNEFVIKCYMTNKPDIRYMIDREHPASDCVPDRIQTHFLVVRPNGETLLLASGEPYLKPDLTTPFHRIGARTVPTLAYTTIWGHVMVSFCRRLQEYGLASTLC